MNAGRESTIKVNGQAVTLARFSLDIWFRLCDWLKARPKLDDPLARISRLPLERLPAEMVDKLTREAIAEDKTLYTFTPGSDAATREMMTPEGLVFTVQCLTGQSESDVKEFIFSLAKEDRMQELIDAIHASIGVVPEKNGQAVGLAAS